jgi:maltooligosyltrehalose trehalohydrolase
VSNGNRLGAALVPSGATFCVWAPFPRNVELRMLTGARAGIHPLTQKAGGLWVGMVEGAQAGDRYLFRVHGPDGPSGGSITDQPDPCSRFQPEGVHGPSELVDVAGLGSRAGPPRPAADFKAPDLRDLVIYELHIGTFTAEGTFDSAIPELRSLREIGFTAVELMPIGQFPGSRNWGYDGVSWFAPQASYGGPQGLARFVDAAHAAGLAVILDCVYNHFGPEGNTLWNLGPYFTHRYKTPWGVALNYDGPESACVREMALQNAIYWLEDYRFDGLRLDAVQSIIDHSPSHLLRDLAERVEALSRRLGRTLYAIAESDQNDVRLIQPRSEGGYGLSAVWSDDFQLALHAALTGERQGVYRDFGAIEQLARALRQGFAFEGEWSQSHGGPHGTVARREAVEKFVVYTQSHDRVGNRPRGERLTSLVDPRAARVAQFLLVVGPGTPLFFMGEEYGELSPFFYFTSFENPDLAAEVARARQDEFQSQAWIGQAPDPQDPATYERSKIDRARRERPGHREMARLTHDLLEWRARLPALRESRRANVSVDVDERKRLLCLRREGPGKNEQVLAMCSFSSEPEVWSGYIPEGRWQLILDAQEEPYRSGDAHDIVRGGFVELRLPPYAARLYRAIE